MLALWPAAYGLSFLGAYPLLSLSWAISCLVMSVFTLLPAMKVEDAPLM